ncbi:MAG: BrnA antitoxin family protein [Pseudomonadota bacterium]
MTKRYKTPLTPEQLAKRSDAEIDYGDIPPLDARFWANATVQPPRTKPNISLRVDADVVAYFKAESPKGYTGRMAAVLKAYVDAQRR